MPSNVIAFSRIQENRENKTGKHYTKEELQKREEAEKALRRKIVRITAPSWLKTDRKKNAYAIWKRIIKQAGDIELLDDVDAGCLAIYCDIQAQYEEKTDTNYPNQKELDRLAKQALSYAEKLGLTPTARARLALKRANETPTDEKENLFE